MSLLAAPAMLMLPVQVLAQDVDAIIEDRIEELLSDRVQERSIRGPSLDQNRTYQYEYGDEMQMMDVGEEFDQWLVEQQGITIHEEGQASQ